MAGITLAEGRRAQRLKLRPDLVAGLRAATCGGFDSHSHKQGSRWFTRIPGITKYGMQSLVS